MSSRLGLGQLVTAAFWIMSSVQASEIDALSLSLFGAQGVNFWRDAKAQAARQTTVKRDTDFPVFNFTQRLDHFNESFEGFTFNQRYWVSTRHFNESDEDAPVVVLDGGETSGEDRLPYLDTGIVDILTEATGGLGVILEHRYYGESIPVQNFSTDALRWLNNEQALEDSNVFMRNVNFSAAGVQRDLTAPNTKWIYYGGSYAGARSAHMRVLYPETVYGAIASSGVTEAIIDYWEYLDTIRLAMNQTCSDNLVGSVKTIDDMLSGGNDATRQVKTLFGLQDLSNSTDFASAISSPLGGWQSKNWDPEVNSDGFDQFCDAMNQVPNNETELGTLPYGDDRRQVNVSLPSAEDVTVDFALANYARYVNRTIVSHWVGQIEDHFGTQNDSHYQNTALSEDWRLWQFQVCTQWGYYQGAPPANIPTIISRLVDVTYNSKICRQAYLPGQFFTVPPSPNVTAVNSLGGFNISMDRLAIIDGEVDPWRAATPHSQYINATERPDTLTRPFKLIPGAVHHWDENGLANRSAEPEEIRAIHSQEVEFVKAWLSGEA